MSCFDKNIYLVQDLNRFILIPISTFPAVIHRVDLVFAARLVTFVRSRVNARILSCLRAQAYFTVFVLQM